MFVYLGVFSALLLEAIGLPFPSETILISSGISLSHGKLLFLPLWLFALAGNLVGSNIAYWIGLHFGRKIVLRFGKFVKITEDRLSVIEKKFKTYQFIFIFIGKFIAFVRIVIPYLAGINKVKFSTFTIFNTIAAALWSLLFIVMGKTIILVWNTESQNLIAHWYISAPSAVLIGWIAWWLHRKLKKVF